MVVKSYVTSTRFRIVVLTAITTFFVGLLLKRFVPEDIFGEPASPLLPKTLAKKDEGAAA